MDWQYWPQNMREAPSYLIHHQNHHNFPDKSNFPEIPAMAAMSLWDPTIPSHNDSTECILLSSSTS